jgi:phage terminase small subunit
MSTTTVRKELFVEEYLKDFNQAKAAVRAGYSENGARTRGSLLMDDPYIQTGLKKHFEARKRQALYDETYIIENLKEIVLKCLERKTVGRSAEQWTIDAYGALKALELLGKHIGMFNPKFQEPTMPTYPVNISIIQAVRQSEERKQI